MKNHVYVSFLMLIVFDAINATPIPNYWHKRTYLLEEEEKMAIGSLLPYQPGERTVNDALMNAKREELATGFLEPRKFAPAENFLEMKKQIEQSEVFKFIKKMPKGGVLHAHDTAIVSGEYLLNNITYRENLYVCESGEKPGEKLSLHFFDNPNDDCDWRLLSDLRQYPDLARSLNDRIVKQISMYDASSEKTIYADGNAAWAKFMSIFSFITPMLTYKPIYEDHYYQGLQELYDDNVFYIEIRSTLPPLYELNGTTYGPSETARVYKEVTEKFIRDHPKFIGAKLIYAPIKTSDSAQLDEYIRTAEELKRRFPDFLAGFDLVGQEDNSPPLIEWVQKLQKIAGDVPFFFHAGETNWNGQTIDENLIDAVLLNSKRIGHGYALLKHPNLLELAKEKNIALEICPISNQVLSLVKDLRNHPASVLFAEDFPVVVSNDDPGFWGARGLSYDFYEAFMGIMSAHADIRAIKQLAINSIKFSSLSDSEKIDAFANWSQQWAAFIATFYPKNISVLNIQ